MGIIARICNVILPVDDGAQPEEEPELDDGGELDQHGLDSDDNKYLKIKMNLKIWMSRNRWILLKVTLTSRVITKWEDWTIWQKTRPTGNSKPP